MRLCQNMLVNNYFLKSMYMHSRQSIWSILEQFKNLYMVDIVGS